MVFMELELNQLRTCSCLALARLWVGNVSKEASLWAGNVSKEAREHVVLDMILTDSR